MPTTAAVIKARTPGNSWGYDKVLDLARIAEGYKRCRRMQCFIVADEYLRANIVECSHCGERIDPDATQLRPKGNRGDYHPKLKKAAVMHYYCAWESLLSEVFRVGRRLYG